MNVDICCNELLLISSPLDTDLPGQVDDSQNRVNGDADGSRKSAVPRRYQQFVTSEDEAGFSSGHSSDEEEEVEVQKDRTSVKSISMSAVPPPVKVEAPVNPVPVKESVKVGLMLNQATQNEEIFCTHTQRESNCKKRKTLQAKNVIYK